MHWLKGLGLPLYRAVVSDQYRDELGMRALIRDFKSDLARAQQRAGLPACYYVEILEGEPAVHSNILFPLDGPNAERDRRIASLLRSVKFQGDELDIQDAGDANGWLAYCSKERVTQARWVGGVGNLAKRLPGSHRLGAGGGDRLRLSKALMAQLLDEGLVRPYRRRYAASSLPKPIPTPSIVYRESLFDDLPVATVPAKAMPMPHPRPPLAPPTLPLVLAPTIAELLTHLGPTHAAIAARVGLSRPQTTNVINGQFGASRRIVRRVLELVRAA